MYSCVQVTGTVPQDVTPGDSIVMDVIVDANVDAVVLGIPVTGYNVVGQNRGELPIRYVEATSMEAEAAAMSALYDYGSQQIIVRNSTEDRHVTIYNMMGEQVMQSNDANISVASLTAGVYVVHITDGEKRIVDKFVKR